MFIIHETRRIFQILFALQPISVLQGIFSNLTVIFCYVSICRQHLPRRGRIRTLEASVEFA